MTVVRYTFIEMEKSEANLTENNSSKRMRLVRSKNTSLEKSFATLLRSNNIRYLSQPKMFGHPDFRIKLTRILVFCDSAFWHGRNKMEISGKAFKTNKGFWVQKLRYNKLRDRKINRFLRDNGWTVLRFWEDDILKRPLLVVSRLRKYVESERQKE